MSGYYGSWYEYGRQYNTLVLLFLVKAQVTIKLSAGGFFNLSLETFTSVNFYCRLFGCQTVLR